MTCPRLRVCAMVPRMTPVLERPRRRDRRLAVVLLALSSMLVERSALAQTPPVVVVPLPGEGLTGEVAQVALDGVVQALGGVVRGRAVTPATQVVGTVMACTPVPTSEEDPTPTIAGCVGGAIAQAGGAAGVMVRMSVAGENLHLDLLVRDAVSGTERGAPLSVDVPVASASDAAALAAALAPQLGALTSALPAPPARAMLLLAINQDGAAVSIDGETVGEAPLAPLEIAPGTHTVAVRAPGMQPFNRSVEVSMDGARVNVDLEPLPEEAAALAAQDAEEAQNFTVADGGGSDDGLTKQWWFWAAVGGGALVLTAIIVGIAVAAGGDDNPQGFRVPPIPGS